MVNCRLKVATVPCPETPTSLSLVVMVYPLPVVRPDVSYPVLELLVPALEMTKAFVLHPCPRSLLAPRLVRVTPEEQQQQQEAVTEEAKAMDTCVLFELLVSSGSIVVLRNVPSCVCLRPGVANVLVVCWTLSEHGQRPVAAG